MPRKKLFGGIYQIRNLINNHFYIGQTVNFNTRKYHHFYKLRKNKHKNIHLQNAYNKYGEENFVFEILLICEKDKSVLAYYEQKYVDILNPEYNIAKQCVISALGVKRSDETKRILSEKNTGEKHPGFGMKRSDETKRKISESHIGKHHSEESRRKMSENRKGKPNGRKGIPCPEEAKRKISNSLKGEKNPNFGKPLPEETKQKMSESKKLWWKKKKGLLDEPDNDGII